MLDGREPSSLRRRPPRAALGSAGALAGLDLSDQALAAASADPASADIRAAGLDLKGGFYLFADDYIADWFGCDVPEAADVFGNPLACRPSGGLMVSAPGDAKIAAVFRGPMMGRSRSLSFSQDLLEEAWSKGLLAVGCAATGASYASAARPRFSPLVALSCSRALTTPT